MPSGGITITPGYQLAPGEKVNNAKLNQLGQPVGQVNEGAIGSRELDATINAVISALKGKNVLCNGSFQLWTSAASTTFGYPHDYGSGASRWVTPTDVNLAITRQQFSTGSTDVPSGIDFLRWNQSAGVTNNPSYLGQRLEDVRRFTGLTVAFSIYLRATGALTVTPKMRQAFGGLKRTIQATITAVRGGTGTINDSGQSFRVTDVGAAISITGAGFTTVNSTIVAFTDASQITIAATLAGTSFGPGLSALITGAAGSGGIVTSGAPLSLVANTWTRLTQAFLVPDVTGMTIPDVALGSFTEFRVEVPQGVSFQLDFANAQVEFATAATAFERRLFHEDLAYAKYYHEVKRTMLSNAVTVWRPSISVEKKLYRPTFSLGNFTSGTGAAMALDFQSNEFLTQWVNHSNIAAGDVTTDAEIRD